MAIVSSSFPTERLNIIITKIIVINDEYFEFGFVLDLPKTMRLVFNADFRPPIIALNVSSNLLYIFRTPTEIVQFLLNL